MEYEMIMAHSSKENRTENKSVQLEPITDACI